MSARDPETGQYVAEDGESHDYYDYENVTFNVATTFDGGGDDFRTDEVQIVDMDDVTDRRREEADLLYSDIDAKMVLADGATQGEAAVQITTGSTIDDEYLLVTDQPNEVQTDDTIDLIGRPLRLGQTVATRDDGTVLHGMTDLADPTFYSRNEINAVTEIRNESGTEGDEVRVALTGQMVFGLRETEDAAGR